ncbi:MAG: hypothetical protein ACRDDZ_01275 [Marinifilaceae bacterium]
MADEFDIVDIVYDNINVDIPVYKGTPKSEDGDHITINTLQFNENDFTGATYVNVNTFVRYHTNGMQRRQLLKTYRRLLKEQLKNLTSTLYVSSEIEFSQILDDVKDGYDCLNIRLKVIIENL